MIKILNFKPVENSSIKGFIDIEITTWANFQIHGIKLFESQNKKWIGFPSYKIEKKTYDDKDIYYPYMKFKDPKTHRIFQDKVIEALEKWLTGDIK